MSIEFRSLCVIRNYASLHKCLWFCLLLFNLFNRSSNPTAFFINTFGRVSFGWVWHNANEDLVIWRHCGVQTVILPYVPHICLNCTLKLTHFSRNPLSLYMAGTFTLYLILKLYVLKLFFLSFILIICLVFLFNKCYLNFSIILAYMETLLRERFLIELS